MHEGTQTDYVRTVLTVHQDIKMQVYLNSTVISIHTYTWLKYEQEFVKQACLTA